MIVVTLQHIMKLFAFGVVIIAAFCVANIFGADEPAKDNAEETLKIYKRLIPADVLRGKCGNKHSIYETWCNI